MGRGRGVSSKKANGRRRRRGRYKEEDDDDEEEDDEEYVLEEEEEEEEEFGDETGSSAESLVASAGESEEEEFDFGGSACSEEDDAEFEAEEEEEEQEERGISRSKPRRRPSNGRRRSRKARVSDDDDDDDDDYEGEEEEEEAEEEEEEAEEEEEEAERTVAIGRKKGRARSRRRKARVSDYEEEEDEEEEDDEDFSPEKEDDEEIEVSLSSNKIGSRRNGDARKIERKRKSRVSKKKNEKKMVKQPPRKRRRKRREQLRDDEDYEDDDFIVKDPEEANRKAKKTRKKIGRRKKKNNPVTVKKRSLVDSDTSDFEYVTSDDEDDFVEEAPVKSKKRRKRRLLIGSDSSDDSDYMISEEELRDLGVGGVTNRPQPKRIFAGRKNGEKGKEKQADDDLGKPICGICLSEEHKGSIQGVLNCCAHFFCFACIMEWSKVESRCPVCKRRFVTITRSSKSDLGLGLSKRVIRVEKRDQVYQPSEEEMRGMLDPYENVVCIECQQGGDDNLMLLCDICDSPAHTYCVGLGREVPEDNWYCECCRTAGEGSSFSQAPDTVFDQGARNNNESRPASFEIDINTPQGAATTTNSQRSMFDLNLSPREFPEEDQVAASQVSTLSGRRAIQQRIRILLSNSSRSRQIFPRTGAAPHIESDNEPLEIQRNRETLHGAEGVNSFQSRPNLAPCMHREGSSLTNVEGAKEQVRSMVKSQLKRLTRDSPLEHDNFKHVARRAMYTILEAFGIKRHGRMVAGPIQPPPNCSHDLDGKEPAFVSNNCCSRCFSSFIKDVVQKTMNESSDH